MCKQIKSTLFVLIAITVTTKSLQYDCSQTEYDRCVKIADPLVKEPHLIFPDNLDDIDLVCRTWNKFVDCLKRYTDHCFSEQQRKQFNKAIENPIESIHKMCRIPHYQKEYLQYASCIKSTITERNHCGPQYSVLVDQVDQGEITSKATLCCTQDRFKQCVIKETRRICDRGVSDGPATRFATQIIDKALSFLQEQCFNYIPNSGDCVSITTDSIPYTDPVLISTSPSEVYPWSTVHEAAAKDIAPSRANGFNPITASWLPSSNVPTYTQQEDDVPTVLGSRTRPASYGRSSWSDTSSSTNTPRFYSSSTPPAIQPKMPELPSASPKPDWMTSDWHNVEEENNRKDDASILLNQGNPQQNSINIGNFYSTSTETWYPAAGNQLANEVDEPNQQGLTKQEENASNSFNLNLGLMLISLLTFSLC